MVVCVLDCLVDNVVSRLRRTLRHAAPGAAAGGMARVGEAARVADDWDQSASCEDRMLVNAWLISIMALSLVEAAGCIQHIRNLLVILNMTFWEAWTSDE